MIVETLSLRDFRNIAEAELSPCGGINILLGDNAQGKTNLVEALWLCTGSPSFRGGQEKAMVRFGAEAFGIALSFRDREREQNIRYSMDGRRRKVWLNGVPARRPDLVGVFSAAVFDPVGMNIVLEGPAERRRFLDDAISQLKPGYAKYLAQYQAVVEQRNAILRDPDRYRQFAATFDVWDDQLSRLGTILSIYRADYVKKLTPVAAQIYGGFTGYAESFSLSYESTVFEPGQTLAVYSDDLIAQYRRVMEESRETDRKMRCTTKGAHRDDAAIEINSLPVRTFGSRGQQRSCAIALKLGEAHLSRLLTGDAPVVLLDDVMSELDQGRQDYILNQIRGFQVLITCCDVSNTLRMESGRIFGVKGGKIETL